MSTTNHRKRKWGEYLRPPREPLSHLISPHTMNAHFPLHNFLFILGGFHDLCGLITYPLGLNKSYVLWDQRFQP